jgi:Domain of unknown function (DUF4158)
MVAGCAGSGSLRADRVLGRLWTPIGAWWANKSGATRLGFAVLLKFFELESRFPRHAGEAPPAAVAYFAEQVRVDPGGAPAPAKSSVPSFASADGPGRWALFGAVDERGRMVAADVGGAPGPFVEGPMADRGTDVRARG